MRKLFEQTANEIVTRLKRAEITPLDCLDALEARISAVDSKVNALPTLCFDRARKNARELMHKPISERGLLAGLPVPIKDLVNVAGVRSTQGSPVYANHIPEKSDVLVTHLENNGAIVYAMSNTPEFGAGANTFNEVFGRTLNPGTRRAPPPVHQVVPPRRWRLAPHGWPTAPISAARFETLQASAAWLVCGPVQAVLLQAPATRSIQPSALKAPWRAMWKTSLCCLMRWWGRRVPIPSRFRPMAPPI
jgi:hypothetical protein